MGVGTDLELGDGLGRNRVQRNKDGQALIGASIAKRVGENQST